MECIVEGVTYQTGDPELKGIAFEFEADNGPNVMSYIGDHGNPSSYSHAISDSQIELLRKHLRYEMPLLQSRADLIDPPAGVYLNANRPDLGAWDAHRQGAFLDFDGDGIRDLAVWDPPTMLGTCNPPSTTTGCGTFRIMRSSAQFLTSSAWTVQFGVLGDVPLVQDYNADGCTDVGVWRTNGSTGTAPTSNRAYSPYCPSTKTGNDCNPPDCSGWVRPRFANRSDVPLHDPFFHGSGGGEIAVFRPWSHTVYWRTYVAGGSNGGFPGPSNSVQIVTASGHGYVPLVGDYDDDGKADPATYLPQGPGFFIRTSSSGYNDLWARWFPGVLAPDDSDPAAPASEQDRAGAFPLENMGILLFSRPTVYFPQAGQWWTQWDVAAGSTPVGCTLGGDDSFPIGGIDRDGDWRTDMVTFYGPTFGGSGTLYFKDSNGGNCSGAVTSRSSSSFDRPRMRPFAVWDMTGDGVVDIILIDPDSMTFYWVNSESDYTNVNARQLGSQRSVPL